MSATVQPVITCLLQFCLSPGRHGISLCTNRPKLSYNWTGPSSLLRNTRAHYHRRQPNPTKKRPLHQAKKQSFVYSKERVLKKLQGWKEKIISQASREVLIKAVIQAIPTYTMSCFKLPKGLIKDLEVLTRKFWWGYGEGSRKVHWVH